MKIPKLGKLKDVKMREAWPHEARDFTPWMAENLDALSEVIGLDLELKGREVSISPFSADILARCPENNSLVLIENQLETADHKHLGQLLTYLAGLNAQTVVWVASEFTDAHLSAVKWLNEHTVSPFAFFAVRVRVVRIADSPMAPVFDVLERPNEWDRQIAREAGEMSELGQFRRDFWRHLKARHPDGVEIQEGHARGHLWFPLEKNNVNATLYISRGAVGIFLRGVRGEEDAEAYSRLRNLPQKVWDDLGVVLEKSGAGRPAGKRLEIDTGDKSNWDRMADWLHEQAEAYKKALS